MVITIVAIATYPLMNLTQIQSAGQNTPLVIPGVAESSWIPTERGALGSPLQWKATCRL